MNVRDVSQIVTLIPPTDLSLGNVAGDWLSVANFNHVEIFVTKAAGASGEPPTLTFVQATDATGTGSKALNFPQYSKKSGTQTGVGAPTYVTQTPTNVITPAAGNTQELWMVEFDASNLDAQNGFYFFSVTIADVGATAQILAALARFSEPRVKSNVSTIA